MRACASVCTSKYSVSGCRWYDLEIAYAELAFDDCALQLVHLLLDADLKSAFIAAEGPQVRGQVDTSSLTAKQFWQLAAAKFNDDEWQVYLRL